MNKYAFSILAACLLLPSAWAANNSFVGKWKLNPAKSRMPDVMKVTAAGPNTFALNFSGDDIETIAADGADHPGLYGSTVAIQVDAPSQWTVIRKTNGRITIQGIWTLSADGKHLTDDFTGYRDNGTTSHLLYVYERKTSSQGFLGTWESISEQMSEGYEIAIQSEGQDAFALTYPAQEFTKHLRLDGKESPATGKNVPAGYVSSAHRINARKLKMTDSLQGKVRDKAEIELAEDGKTLTMTQHVAGHTQPDILVFERQ